MCCERNSQYRQVQGQKETCGCSGVSCSGPAFWSKKKRIQMVEHSIECFQTKISDLHELLQELKSE